LDYECSLPEDTLNPTNFISFNQTEKTRPSGEYFRKQLAKKQNFPKIYGVFFRKIVKY